MSDESSAEIRDARKDWMVVHREQYVTSQGLEGHIADLTPVGGYPFTTHCLIRYTGRKSGKTFITPLIYGDIGGEVILVASKGGADSHPAWYLNIRDSETVDFQIGGQAYRASWREPEGADREKIWNFMVDVFPPYAGYQASTDRVIPLIALKPIEPIDRFRMEDATGERKL